MEPWGYEGKGLLFSEDMELPIESISRSRNLLSGWDVSEHRHEDENVNFMELGFFELMKKTPPVNPHMGILTTADELGNSSSSHQICSGEEHGGEKYFSSSLIKSNNSQDSSLIDLKLGRLADLSDGRCTKQQHKENNTIFSPVSSASYTAKRSRISGAITQAPLCQVHGCNTDLTSAKDYHKRHRVCDVHSKTAKVVVNGIEQRFCQQCSRFHLLLEFDDGKRSCRKRLAGHNERRRKPHFSSRSARPHDMMESYQDNEFMGDTDQRRRSFLAGGGDGVCGERRIQGESGWRGVKIGDTNPCYRPHFVQLHHLGNNKLTEEAPIDQSSSTIPDLSEVTTSSTSAVSFLSSDGISVPETNLSYTLSHITETHNGVYYPSSSSGIHHHNQQQQQNQSSIDATCSTEVEFGVVEGGGGFMGTATKYSLPPHGLTVDLLQLSSHLQRVGQQRNSIMVKQENDDFCCF